MSLAIMLNSLPFAKKRRFHFKYNNFLFRNEMQWCLLKLDSLQTAMITAKRFQRTDAQTIVAFYAENVILIQALCFMCAQSQLKPAWWISFQSTSFIARQRFFVL